MARVTSDPTIVLTPVEREAAGALKSVSALHLFRVLWGGLAGEKVLLAAATGAGTGAYLGTCVLKFVAAGSPADCAAATERHLLARAAAMDRHMPALLDCAERGPWRAYLYDNDGHRLTDSRSLIDPTLNRAGAIDGIRQVAAMLTAWNRESAVRTTAPFELLTSALPEPGSHWQQNLLDRAARLGVDPGDPLLRIFRDEPALPNPIAFGRQQTLRHPDVQPATAPWGHVHGDLHAGNIMVVPVEGHSWRTYVIDAARYEPAGPWHADVALLELSLLLHYLDPEIPVNRALWGPLCRCLASTTALEPDRMPVGAGALALILPELRRAIAPAGAGSPGPVPVFTAYGLAAVAGALNLFGRLSAPWSQRAALLYGGHYLKTVLARLGVT